MFFKASNHKLFSVDIICKELEKEKSNNLFMPSKIQTSVSWAVSEKIN
jgi:hypothetical protein